MKAIEIREYIESLPKTVDSNGCWIPNLKPEKDGHIRVMINYTRYVLSRLTLPAYKDIDYFADTLARHKCNNAACFNHEHILPGTHSENMLDSVAAKTHIHARKDVCPKCGGPYSKRRNGNGKQVWSRRCNRCIQARRKELRKAKNESL